MNQITHFLYYMSFVIIGFTVLEFGMDLIKRREQRDPKETFANLGVYAVQRFWNYAFNNSFMLAFFGFVSSLIPWSIPSNLGTMVAAVLVADFLYYWQHRYSHEVRLLWSYHSVHHSSKEFNLSTANRLPWIGVALNSLFYMPMVLMGFDPITIIVSKSLVLFYQYWIHTERVGKLGWFDRFFNSPSNHRVHHGSNAEYLDRNHGGILIIWDRLFGTYAREESKVVYGLTTPLKTYNPVLINFHEPVAMIRDVMRAKTLRDKLGYVFGYPGWQPH